jgi:hypothetical protein
MQTDLYARPIRHPATLQAQSLLEITIMLYPTTLSRHVSLALGLALAATASAQPLPEGNSGIAARYPGDVGIASDPSVIFADDFESYSKAGDLTSRWNQAYHLANIRIATESGRFFSGTKALELTVPFGAQEVSNQLVQRISPERDILFLRYYAKFDTAYNAVGSVHNGGTISAHYCCPGVRADGYNKFYVSYEADRLDTATPNPGLLNVYVYYPDQRDVWGDHFYPTGIVAPFTSTPYNFGPEFVSRPNVVPQLGRWYAYELMVKANTPGLKNGRIAMWLDGKLIADFMNIRLRETTALKIDQFTIDLYVKNNSLGVTRKWYDNVVVATSYIGPMLSGQRLPAPTNLRRVQ